jgi:hypothetical protein
MALIVSTEAGTGRDCCPDAGARGYDGGQPVAGAQTKRRISVPQKVDAHQPFRDGGQQVCMRHDDPDASSSVSNSKNVPPEEVKEFGKFVRKLYKEALQHRSL